MLSIRQYKQLQRSVNAQLDGIPPNPSASQRPSVSHSEKSQNGDDEKAGVKSASAEDRGASIARQLSGVEVRDRTPAEGGEGLVFVVRWNGPEDPLCPYKWGLSRRLVATGMTALLAAAVTATSSIEAAVQPQAADYFHVSDTAAALTTGGSI